MTHRVSRAALAFSKQTIPLLAHCKARTLLSWLKTIFSVQQHTFLHAPISLEIHHM